MLLNRSNDLIIEQDERVKAANSLILATKCRAIRFAQIAEKQVYCLGKTVYNLYKMFFFLFRI